MCSHCSGVIDQPKELTLKVAGMSCQHCQQAVIKALMGLDGVQDVQVNLKEGLVKVVYNPVEAGLPEFKEAIEDAGYEVL
ncbi:MAG: cation transporter [Thermacetogeniaceae bacterium]|jgi:copper ion binding protein|nr:heavy-metal-associated domain-containing protein [Syntrophomonadaceae bacterium]HAF17548.1 copper resistance protein CopZ [Peptococcaceae bacterium]